MYKKTFFVVLLCLLGQSVFATEQCNQSSDLNDLSALEILSDFAQALVCGSHSINALKSELAASKLDLKRRRLIFNPVLDVVDFDSTSTERTYNPATGLEEDYSTERTGKVINLRQATPLGQLSLSMEKSESVFADNATIYFESLGFILETGLLRRDYLLMSLENKVAHTLYTIEKAQRDALIYDVLMRGFEALLHRQVALKNLEFKQNNLFFYQKLLEEAEIKLENGLGSQLDLKQARMRHSLAQTTLKETEITFNDADRRIDFFLGTANWHNKNKKIELDTLLVPNEYDLELAMNLAIKKRPDIQLLLNQFDMQKYTYKISREKARPNIVATYRRGKQGRSIKPDIASRMPESNWYVSVSYTTTLGHQPERLTKRAEEERLTALEHKVNELLANTQEDLTGAVDRILFNKSNLETLKDSFQLSKEVLEGQQNNFKLGTISLLDLSNYQTEFEQTQLSVINAEVALTLSWIKFLYLTGQIQSTFLPEIVEMQ